VSFRAKTSERKREREKIKQERFKLKQLRRLEAKQRKARQKEMRRHALQGRKIQMGSGNGREDPDIAGIVPGPQPLPEQWNYAESDAELSHE